MNGRTEAAVRLPVVMVSGEKLVPGGTVTVRELDVAAVTGARTEPSQTILEDNVGLKFRPLMVIVEPTGPAAGEKDVMTGCEKTTKGSNSTVRKNNILLRLPIEGFSPG